MSSALTLVPFNGDAIECVQNDGATWVMLRRLCSNLGIQESAQVAKLEATEWAITSRIEAVAADGKEREQVCLHLQILPMWLATIHPSKVAEGVRPKLVAYQKHAAKVLADYFLGTQQAQTPQMSGPDLARIATALEAIAERLPRKRGPKPVAESPQPERDAEMELAEGSLRGRIEEHIKAHGIKRIRTRDVIDLYRGPMLPERAIQMMAGRCLRALGWVKVRSSPQFGEARGYVFCAPEWAPQGEVN